jgi:hypothetical protein
MVENTDLPYAEPNHSRLTPVPDNARSGSVLRICFAANDLARSNPNIGSVG